MPDTLEELLVDAHIQAVNLAVALGELRATITPTPVENTPEQLELDFT